MIVNHIDTRDLAKLRGLRSRLHNGQRVPTFDELRDIAETMLVILNRVESVEITEERAIAAEARAEVERLTKERDNVFKALDLSASARDALMVERDTYKASWERLTVEKAQSSWGEFQRQSKMLKEAQAEVERLTHRNDTLKAQRDDAVARAPHNYQPSVAHMGDCFICGNQQDAPQHLTEIEKLAQVKQLTNLRDSWKERAEALEAQVKRLLAKDAERIGRALSEESQ